MNPSLHLAGKHGTTSGMDYQLITTTAALEAFCQRISGCSLLAMDTEFMRERTYWPQLCLIQLASDAGNAMVDPLADGISLEPLAPILANPAITKILHSGDQDVELFHTELNTIPDPVFDTQIAAMALGYGEAVAYHNLVHSLLGVSIDKSQQYTHWQNRPLTASQLDYAIADVTHLLALTPTLMDGLAQRGRTEWVAEATRELINPKRFTLDIDRVVKRIKHNLRKPQQLAALKALVSWREKQAMQQNLPRGFVLKDEVVTELAHRLPTTPDQIAQMRLLTPIKSVERQKAIIAVLDQVRQADPATYPAPPTRPEVTANPELVGLLSLILKQRCRDEGIAPRLIANRGDLEAIAIGRTDTLAMQGWRYDVFGRYAEQMLAGNLHFHWDAKEQTVVMD